ncbi:MAG TPA: hypothetical protein VKA68_05810 [bacterium]|nr:hypothetical protein [bacterium]
MANAIEDIQRILADARRELLAKPNVVATGIGYKQVQGKPTEELSIVCSVDRKQAKQSLTARELVPASIQNIPTDVFISGNIRALQNPTDRVRPAPGGVSIGHVNITAGTLGCLVNKGGETYILSNNHVLANSNDASPGDPIVQPGPHDGGGDPQDTIAELSEFVPIEFEGGDSTCAIGGAAAVILNALAAITGSKTRLRPIRAAASPNLVDAAIAQPLEPNMVVDEILNIGTIAGVAEGTLGMSVKKSGRTTGFTTGTIQQINVTSRVSYGPNKVAVFEDQLMAGAMSQGGDSGSAVLNDSDNLVGLLFAGSDTTTLFNRIQNVFTGLQVSR